MSIKVAAMSLHPEIKSDALRLDIRKSNYFMLLTKYDSHVHLAKLSETIKWNVVLS